MEPIRDPEVLARFEAAFDLYQVSVEMMCLNLHRRYPDAEESEIERRLADWLLSRPEDPPGTPLKVVDTARRQR
jgi:hypothetical protein